MNIAPGRLTDDDSRIVRVVSGGRLQLPADFRHALELTDGDRVSIRMVDGELHVIPYREVVRRVQRQLRKHITPGVSLVDELIADRRAEAASE